MTKAEFLKQLGKRISSIKPHERKKALAYYSELIDDSMESGMTEEEAVASLGNIDSIATQLLNDANEQGNIKASVSPLLIVLAILGSPIWGSLLIAVLAVLFAVTVTVFSLLFAAVAAVLGIGIGGAALVIASIASFGVSFLPSLFNFGVGLVLFAISALIVLPTFKLFKLGINGMIKLFCLLFKIKTKPEETKPSNVSRVFYVISGGTLAIGLVLMIVAAVTAGFNPENMFKTYNAKEVTHILTAQDFAQLNIDVNLDNITVKPSDNEQITVTYYDSEIYTHDLNKNNGKTNIVSHNNARWYQQIGLFGSIYGGYNLTLEIPANIICENMTLTSNVGDIKIEDVSTNVFGITTNTGDINIKRVSAQTIKTKADTGDIKIDNISGSQKIITLIEAISHTGDIKLSDVSYIETVKCKCDTGEIKLENIDNISILNCESETGDVEVSIASNISNISCETETGDIELENVDAQTLKFTSETGDIEGYIAGSMNSYSITSDTDFGDNNLPSNTAGGSRSLYAETSIGDINILFRGN